MVSASTDGAKDHLQVLVVDDEQEFVATLCKRLSKRGLASTGVFSGAAAIAAVKRHDFAVILLDMKLPDLDGNSVLRELKKLKPETPVIILTGHISAKDGIQGREHGANDYLMKPVEFESLFESLHNACHGTADRKKPDPVASTPAASRSSPATL